MEFFIGDVTERTISASSTAQYSDGGLFRSELAGAVGKQSDNLGINSDYFGGASNPMVVISPKIEEKMRNDPDFSEELSQKLNELLHNQGKSIKDSIVIVNKNGEISQYCTRSKREPEHPTAEELKEVAKARARRKARLDAYFHLLERTAIRRKLIEQENAKRLLNKKYRRSVSGLDIETRARQNTAPPKSPGYFL